MKFSDGIHAQPAVLERNRHSVQAALPHLPSVESASVIALVGVGASEHAARGAAQEWRAARLRAYPVSAAEMLDGQDAGASLYVAISESGRSSETVAAMKRLNPAQCIGITNDPASPLGRAVGSVVTLESGDDSPVYTVGYTATLQTLGLIGEHWAGRKSNWVALPQLVSDVITSFSDVVGEISAHLAKAVMLDVVASGTSITTAGEGALLLRESARLRTANFETYNYLHGPMEPLDAATGCLIIGDGREVRLAQEVSALGCPTLLITTRKDIPADGGLRVFTLPTVESPLGRAVLEILPVQMIGSKIAQTRGLAVDGFRYRQDDTKLP